MPKKKSFTLDDHYKTSIIINQMSLKLLKLSEEIIPVYGVSSSVGKEIEKLVRSPNVFSNLKLSLENAFATEHAGDRKDNPYFDGRGHC
jgi:hypothetical protein